MNLQKDPYIIVEVIPTHSNPEHGFIAQISALKLEGIQLLDRFDYRVTKKFIDNDTLQQMISYDKDSFTYVNNKEFIIEKFKQWSKGYPLLLLEETYTSRYLQELDNPKELVYPHLNLSFSDEVWAEIMQKYGLQPSNHLVDLIYEAIIMEGNNK